MPRSLPAPHRPADTAGHPPGSVQGDLITGAAHGDWACWKEIVTHYEPLVLSARGRWGCHAATRRTWPS
jgi:hypothetical protein